MINSKTIISLKPHTIIEFDGTEWTNVSVKGVDSITEELIFTFGKNGQWSLDLDNIKSVISETETINFKISEETQIDLFARESSIDHWI
jgi:hypothetical protein